MRKNSLRRFERRENSCRVGRNNDLRDVKADPLRGDEQPFANGVTSVLSLKSQAYTLLQDFVWPSSTGSCITLRSSPSPVAAIASKTVRKAKPPKRPMKVPTTEPWPTQPRRNYGDCVEINDEFFALYRD